MKQLQNGLSVRGDAEYCPLCFSLDSYWNCFNDCHNCYIRFMNTTWGEELRPLNVRNFERKLRAGLKNKTPKSSLANCIAKKKTIRWGNKTDPFQKVERKYKISYKVFKILLDMKWSFIIQTKCTDVMMDYEELLVKGKELATVLPYITPGLEKDRELFERNRTAPITQRLSCLKRLKGQGVNIGVNGEPFIPGHHTTKDFRDTLRLLKSYGIRTYNTYNLHLNPHVAKRLNAIGLDIEKIWEMNQDVEWKKILSELIDIAKKENVRLGCPDFVNSGMGLYNYHNTCCGVNVPNPSLYNTHTWKRAIQQNEEKDKQKLLNDTWEGIGDREKGEQIVQGCKNKNFYTLGDIIK